MLQNIVFLGQTNNSSVKNDKIVYNGSLDTCKIVARLIDLSTFFFSKGINFSPSLKIPYIRELSGKLSSGSLSLKKVYR